MDNEVRRLLKAFEALPESKKSEFYNDLREYGNRGRLNEEVRKELGVSMGPLGGKCPYCGK